MRLFRATVGDRLLIGELYLPIERLVAYYASGLDMPANFHLLTCEWSAPAIAAGRALRGGAAAGAWPNWVLSNHDRRASPRGSAPRRPCRGMLLTTLRGTPAVLRR